MSVSIAVTNLGSRPFSMPGFGTMAAAPAVTKTKVIKQVRADDISKNFDNLGKFGVIISENGTARPGSVVVTTTATLLAAQKAVLVDMTASFTLTLAALAGFAVGDTVCIFLRSRVAGTLTIDGSGAETVNGSANATLTAAGQILRIEKASTTAWVTATV
jgi:hypothetical protein